MRSVKEPQLAPQLATKMAHMGSDRKMDFQGVGIFCEHTNQ